MNYRLATILAEESITGTGTKTVDVKVKDIISRLTIALRRVKSKHPMDDNGYADISKIELVEGSEVLHSLNGGENQALCIYDRKCGSMNNGEHMATVDEYDVFGIDFGRFLFDPVLAFDPRRFLNPQLKITYDVDVSDTGVTTAYLEIWADCFDEKIISPMGFLSAKEHYSYTPASSAVYEYIDLPTDRVLRKMLIRGYKKGYEPWYQVTAVKIDEDNDKRIPFDWTDMEDYTRIMRKTWAPVEELFAGWGDATGKQYYVLPTCYFLPAAFSAYGVANNAAIGGNSTKGGSILVQATGEAQVGGIVSGFLPAHCFEFAFGDPQDPADWYDVTKVGSLRLRLKSGAGYSSSAIGVVIQQLRKY